MYFEKVVFVVLISISNIKSTLGSKCEPITTSFCKGLSYNETTFPNSLNHQTQEDAKLRLQSFSPLIQTQCSEHLEFFLCTVYVPLCRYHGELILPCRSFCELVRDGGCKTILEKFGFPWPSSLKCDKFPTTRCISENQTEVDACAPNPCDGTCVKNSEDDGYTCTCPAGKQLDVNGRNCRECPNDRYGQNCTNQCMCTPKNTESYDKRNGTCYCKPGWKGISCSEDIKECTDIPKICGTNSVCTEELGGYSCSARCLPGYTLSSGVCTILPNSTLNFERRLQIQIDEYLKESEKQQGKMETLNLKTEKLSKALQNNTNRITALTQLIQQMEQNSLTAIRMSNYNEQYSKRNNIKMFNFPEKENENIEESFLKMVNDYIDSNIQKMDILEIHRIPDKNKSTNPVIVKMINFKKKSIIMKGRRNLTNGVKLFDDITRMNAKLINKLRASGKYKSVWYNDGEVWAKTFVGKRLKFDITNDMK